MRSRILLVLGLLAPVLVLLAPAPAAVAASSVTLEGHGYGHGRGMSQYGAYGAALQGRTASQILGYYYPGTVRGSNNSAIKVWLTKDDDGDTTVLAKSALRLTDYGNQTTVQLPAKGNPAGSAIKAWRLTRVADGSTHLAYLTDTWRSLKTLEGEGEFRSTDGTITLRRPGGDVQYWGNLRHTVGRNDPTQAITVNIVSLDKYVRGVLPSEVFTSWPSATLRAQAIAARTYAANRKDFYAGKTYHVCDSTSCQVYGGKAVEAATTTKAVADTSGMVLLYDGKAAFTEFSSASGGWTVKGSEPYLTAKIDKFDDFPQNTKRDWGPITVSGAAISAAYPSIGTFTNLQVLSRDGNGEWGGRVTSVKITGTSGTTTDTGEKFRQKLVLRSTWFNIVSQP